MIARREGDGWTLIHQMDHAAHCAELARAWRAGPFAADRLEVEVDCARLERPDFRSHEDLRTQLAKAPREIRKTVYEASVRRSA